MKNKAREVVKKWWRGLKYDPSDPKYYDQIKITAIGGGSGLSNLLEGIKHFSQDITAIVTVSDSGMSSGRIRREFDILPPGDIRKCLAALSKRNGTLREIFDYRFTGNGESEGLTGHAFGNIWLAALTQYFGSFEKAIEESGNLLDIIGKVYPATFDKVDLECEFQNGQKVVGEAEIAEFNQPIKSLKLTKRARAYAKAVKAIEEAQLIVIGPGSLFTSIIPNFLIPGIAKAVKGNKQALRIFVCNVSTERGETEDLSAEDHIKILLEYARNCVDVVLVNNKVLRKSKEVHKIGEINNITLDQDEVLGVKTYLADVIDEKNSLYHDNQKLAKAVINCYNDNKV